MTRLSRRQLAAIALKAQGIYSYGHSTVIMPRRVKCLTPAVMHQRENFGRQVYNYASTKGQLLVNKRWAKPDGVRTFFEQNDSEDSRELPQTTAGRLIFTPEEKEIQAAKTLEAHRLKLAKRDPLEMYKARESEKKHAAREIKQKPVRAAKATRHRTVKGLAFIRAIREREKKKAKKSGVNIPRWFN